MLPHLNLLPASALSGFGVAAFAAVACPAVPRSTFALRATADTIRTTMANRGGEYRARTGDLLVANQALSQLS